MRPPGIVLLDVDMPVLNGEIEKNGFIPVDGENFAGLVSRLSEREKEAAHLALRGMSNFEISEKLSRSVNYIKKLMSGLYDKLGINSRKELKENFMLVEKKLTL